MVTKESDKVRSIATGEVAVFNANGVRISYFNSILQEDRIVVPHRDTLTFTEYGKFL
ncbi:MAG: hypothetical protein Q4C58_11805 [Eubacteriales bacterium]|nr:hypothetical protein [Eubacteriales bacterium]